MVRDAVSAVRGLCLIVVIGGAVPGWVSVRPAMAQTRGPGPGVEALDPGQAKDADSTPKDQRARQASQLFVQGNQLLEQNQPEAAIAAFQQALQHYQALQQRQQAGQTLKAIGNAYFDLKNYAQAIAYHRQALAIAQAIGDTDLQARALNNIGSADRYMGQPDRGIANLQAALAIAQASQNHLMQVIIAQNLADSYEAIEQTARAIDFRKQALAIAQQFLKGSPQELNLLIDLASDFNSDYPIGHAYAEAAVALARTRNDRPGLLRALIALSGVQNLAAIGLHTKTLEDDQARQRAQPQIQAYTALGRQSAQEAIRLAQELQDGAREAKAHDKAGVAYYYAGDAGRSLQQFQQAVALYQRLNQPANQAKSEFLSAVAEQDLGNSTAAVASYQRAAALYRQLNQPPDLYKTLMQLVQGYHLSSSAAIAKERYPEALAAINEMFKLIPEAEQLAQSLANPEFVKEVRDSEAEAHNQMGTVYLERREFSQAEAATQKARNIARRSENWQAENRALGILQSIYGHQGDGYKIIAINQRIVELAPKLGNPVSEVYALLGLTDVYSTSGNVQKTVEVAQQALEKAQRLDPNRLRAFQRQQPLITQILALRYLATAQSALGNYQAAQTAIEQWIGIAQKLGNWQNQATAWTRLSQIQVQQQALPLALQSAQRALQLTQQRPPATTQAEALAGIEAEVEALIQVSTIQMAQDHIPQALDQTQQALKLAQASRDPGLQMLAWSALSNAYGAQRQTAKSLDALQQAVTLAAQLPNPKARSAALTTLGEAYQRLGDYATSRTLFQQILTNAQAKQDQQQEAFASWLLAVNAFNDHQPPQQIIALADRSLTLARGKMPILEAGAQYSLALAHTEAGHDGNAMTAANAYLALARQLQNPTMASNGQMLLGSIHYHFGRTAPALAAYQAALAIPGQKNDQKEGILVGLAQIYRDRQQPTTAIVFYKQAINRLETTRRSLQGLPLNLQKSFLQATFDFGGVKIADIYRQLADVLIAQGRIGEAQQVLELLKIQELDDLTPQVRGNNRLTELALNPTEQDIQAKYTNLIAFGQRARDCKQDCAPIKAQLTTLREQFETYQQTLQKNLTDGTLVRVDERNKDFIASATKIVNAQPGTVLIYPLVLPDKVHLLWAAPGGVLSSVTCEIGESELNKLIAKFQTNLQTPYDLDTTKQNGKALYDCLIKPLEEKGQWQKNNIRHLVIAADRAINYLPIGALFDGKQFLVERYTVSNVLNAGLTDVEARLPTQPTVLGLGITDKLDDFSALPNVSQELQAIVRSAQTPQGLYPGSVLLNQAASATGFEDQLNSGQFQIVHIATHGQFEASNPNASYLLFSSGTPGKGEHYTASRIKQQDALRKIHLVILSACQTGRSEAAASGIEIQGMSAAFLRDRAKSVIASLWNVNDISTSLLMQRFYQNLATGKLSKAAALQQAQLSLIQGKPQDGSAPKSDPNAFAHPYYWAPFILIGNPF
jgi:CHAT domain-containing protein